MGKRKAVKVRKSRDSGATVRVEDFDAVVEDIRVRFPKLSADDRFVLWFLLAYVTDDEARAADAVAGGARDKGIDALLIDDASRCVFVVQAKYRKSLGVSSEKRADVISLAEIPRQLANPNAKEFAKYIASVDALVAKHLKDARERVLKRDYKIWLYFFSLGKVSRDIRNDADSEVRSTPGNASIEIIDAHRAVVLLRDYLDGVAPPIPALKLEMESGPHVTVNSVAQRYDQQNDIESWVFSMRGSAIAEIYEHAGIRLFARNIRGFLGSTAVNRGMVDTLKKEPDKFFYYNNGVTILCDLAKKESYQGRDVLQVSNPQVINGQQTTRTLSEYPDQAAKASVLVKVVQVANRPERNSAFDNLLSKIVAGTNWQNAIKASDLMANDRTQVDLERALRKFGYAYIRKRQTKGETRRLVGNKHMRYVTKEEFAQVIAACEIDPLLARTAREKLFEEQVYKSIFSTNDPLFYLPRYWVMYFIHRVTRTDQRKREARFLVAHLIWSLLKPLIRSQQKTLGFVTKCEQGDAELLTPLGRAIARSFVASDRFYKAKRGTGPDAVDLPTFYKSKRANATNFLGYWNGDCQQRELVNKDFAKIALALE